MMKTPPCAKNQSGVDFLLKCLLYTVSTWDGEWKTESVIHSWNCPPDVRGFPIGMRPLHRVHSGREMEDGVGLLSPVLCLQIGKACTDGSSLAHRVEGITDELGTLRVKMPPCGKNQSGVARNFSISRNTNTMSTCGSPVNGKDWIFPRSS